MLVDSKGRACAAEAVQQGTGKTAAVARWMPVRSARTRAPTDLALAVIVSPLDGYYFSIASASPKSGELVIALGYALGEPLSLNQGHVARLITSNKVRLLEMRLLEAGGASGGPILNAEGQVVGLGQFGTVGVEQYRERAEPGGPRAFEQCERGTDVFRDESRRAVTQRGSD